jgi:hypothetical protein
MSSLFPKKRKITHQKSGSVDSNNNTDNDEDKDEMLEDFGDFERKLSKKKSSVSSTPSSLKRGNSTLQRLEKPSLRKEVKEIVAIDDEPTSEKPIVVPESITEIEIDLNNYSHVPVSNETDDVVESLKRMKRKLTDANQQLNEPNKKNSNRPIDVDDLTGENAYGQTIKKLYSLPKVLSATERAKLITKQDEIILEGDNEDEDTQEEEKKEEMISLKTRINGGDERKWQIPFGKNFQAVRFSLFYFSRKVLIIPFHSFLSFQFQSNISKVYGLPFGQFSLIFDGDGIDWKQDSPESLQLENEDLLDIKVNEYREEKLFFPAVLFFYSCSDFPLLKSID